MPLVICRLSVEHYYVSLSLSIQALCFWQFSSVTVTLFSLKVIAMQISNLFVRLNAGAMNTPLKHVQWDPSVKTHATPQNQTKEVSTGGWSLGRVYLHGNVEGKASEKNNNRPYILSSLLYNSAL